MDKTSAIVVGSCIALLAANWWYTSNQTPPPQAPAPQAQTAPATPAEVTPGATPQPLDNTPATPVALTPATPVPQVIATLTSKDAEGKPVARYSFQDIGGSIKSVDMIGQAINSTKEELRGDVSLNGNVPQGIGTFMFRLSNSAEPAFDQTAYRVDAANTNDKQVTLLAAMGDLTVRKVYRLKPLTNSDGEVTDGNAYVVTLDVSVWNTGKTPLSVANWGLYAGGMSQINHSEGSIYTHYIMLENGDFEKETRGSFDPFFGSAKSRLYVTDCKKLEWVGTMNQYYSTVVMPKADSATNAYYAAPTRYKLPVTNEEVDGVEIAAGIPEFTLAAPSENMPSMRNLSYQIFTGPKLNLMLEDMTQEIPKIEQIMDYGWLYLISYPMNALINIFHSWFGNWGWAIVAMTFVVRLLIWPLYRKSYMSMKRMSLLQPKMKELKEKYPDDQQKVSMEMMRLYKEYGISPFGGCLPMFLQIPIFFAFFYVLQTAAELRGAPFLGWVTDLSQMDTVCTLPFTIMGWEPAINVLPFVMAASMIAMMKMTPQAGDPTQQKIMKFMPVMFFLFCYTYPSALALYWTTTNIISIIQTLIIRRLPQPTLEKVDPKKQKQPKKGGFLDRMQRMMEEQQKALEEQKRQAAMRNNGKK